MCSTPVLATNHTFCICHGCATTWGHQLIHSSYSSTRYTLLPRGLAVAFSVIGSPSARNTSVLATITAAHCSCVLLACTHTGGDAQCDMTDSTTEAISWCASSGLNAWSRRRYMSRQDCCPAEPVHTELIIAAIALLIFYTVRVHASICHPRKR